MTPLNVLVDEIDSFHDDQSSTVEYLSHTTRGLILRISLGCHFSCNNLYEVTLLDLPG